MQHQGPNLTSQLIALPLIVHDFVPCSDDCFASPTIRVLRRCPEGDGKGLVLICRLHDGHELSLALEQMMSHIREELHDNTGWESV